MAASLILMGVIGRPHGVRGLVHVTSYTERPQDLFAYGPLRDEQGRRFVLTGRGEGLAELAVMSADGRSEPVRDRDAAARLTNTRLYVNRDALPPPEDDDDFYLADLIGLAATDPAGGTVGRVVAIHDYGGGASLEIAGEGPSTLVAFTRASVPLVDLQAGRLVVVPPVEIDGRDAP